MKSTKKKSVRWKENIQETKYLPVQTSDLAFNEEEPQSKDFNVPIISWLLLSICVGLLIVLFYHQAQLPTQDFPCPNSNLNATSSRRNTSSSLLAPCPKCLPSKELSSISSCPPPPKCPATIICPPQPKPCPTTTICPQPEPCPTTTLYTQPEPCPEKICPEPDPCPKNICPEQESSPPLITPSSKHAPNELPFDSQIFAHRMMKYEANHINERIQAKLIFRKPHRLWAIMPKNENGRVDKDDFNRLENALGIPDRHYDKFLALNDGISGTDRASFIHFFHQTMQSQNRGNIYGALHKNAYNYDGIRIDWDYLESLEGKLPSINCNDSITYVSSTKNDGFGAQLIAKMKVMAFAYTRPHHTYIHKPFTAVAHFTPDEMKSFVNDRTFENLVGIFDAEPSIEKLPLWCPIQYGIDGYTLHRHDYIPSKEFINSIRERHRNGPHPFSNLFTQGDINCAIHVRRGKVPPAGFWRLDKFTDYERLIIGTMNHEPNCVWHLFSQGQEDDFQEFSGLIPNLIFHLEENDTGGIPDSTDESRTKNTFRTWISFVEADYLIYSQSMSTFSITAALLNSNTIVVEDKNRDQLGGIYFWNRAWPEGDSLAFLDES